MAIYTVYRDLGRGRKPSSRGGSSYRGQGNSSSQGNSQGGSYGGSSQGNSGYRGGNSRGNYSGGRRGGGKRGFPVKSIDVSRYMNKSVASAAPVAPYVPKHAFVDFAFEQKIKDSVVKKGYIKPTPIQDQSIPVILAGSDVVGIANTGTGKTAAFLLPLINKVLLNKQEQILIMAPTRELAQQIDEELKGFTQGMGIFSVICVGGSPIGKQLRDLRYLNNFVIGTPGRLKDLMERRALVLTQFKTVVLDEADRMLDMGFIADMRMIMAKMSLNRHTLFFSATLSPEIERLIHDFLKNPVRISVKTQDTAKNIEQDVVRVPAGKDKVDHLHDLLKQVGFDKVLIFGRTKHGVERLSDTLSRKGITSVSIHGNKSQGQRQRALEDFKKSRSQVMVATDVAARGLDIPNVSHVINFDLPGSHEDYIHRIGRTGRGDKKGKALTFVN